MSASFLRRDFLKLAARATAGYGVAKWSTVRAANELPPVRAITRGPLFHWFGYYDKLQFDPSSRYALGNKESSLSRISSTPKRKSGARCPRRFTP